MKRTIALPLLLVTAMLQAQEENPAAEIRKRNLEWAIALGDRFRRLHEPVIATYAISQLGELVCAYDPEAATGLFREALVRVRNLTPTSFTSARNRLPIPSFTSLWKSITPQAVKCAPGLNELIDAEGAQAKMQEEKQQGNADVRTGYSILDVDKNPDRAAQLVETALSVSDPTLLDIPTVTLFLSDLRDKAPDVSHELFPEVLNFIASAKQPSPGLLLDLGEYLFTAPRYVDGPDFLQGSDIRQVGNTTIANFLGNRKSSSPDDIHDYIVAAIKVLTASDDPYYDPVAAYAIGYQMVSKVDDYAPEIADELRAALPQIEQQAGSSASQVRNALTGAGLADPEGGEGARLLNQLVGRAIGLIGARRFSEAREVAQKIDEAGIGSEVRTLIQFGETTAALERKDAQGAFTLSNPIPRGMKRALLYAGMTASARSVEEALGYLTLGFHDSGLLPAEQRMPTSMALMNAIVGRDLENGILSLDAFVEAANDASVNPHLGRFEPDVIRKISQTADTFTDSALILADRRCLCEVVDSGRGRHSFNLKVAGLETSAFTDAIRELSPADVQRIESVLIGIKDENLMSSQLIGLAKLRLGK